MMIMGSHEVKAQEAMLAGGRARGGELGRERGL